MKLFIRNIGCSLPEFVLLLIFNHNPWSLYNILSTYMKYLSSTHVFIDSGMHVMILFMKHFNCFGSEGILNIFP